ncbi:MAG: hypothetical protein Q8M02_08015 [Candidatus Didemnitutus sp.]|nr:hypothetical protein [Candidatus Didemnitutus sp.]
MKNCLLRILTACALTFGLSADLAARDGDTGVVNYLPATRNVEGDQPLFDAYVLTITSPANALVGQNTTITPVLTVLIAPAGVSNVVALSHVTLNPATLVFTGPNQSLTTLVTSNYPVGTEAGQYAFAISTPGWPAGTIDRFGFINAKITIPDVPTPPLVNLVTPEDGTIYYYTLGGPPVIVPVTLTATATLQSPLTNVDANIGGISVDLTTTGLGTDEATGAGELAISVPGIYTVQARATNEVGTSTDSADITITVLAAPPTVAIQTPLPGSSYTYIPGTNLQVPFTFAAVSQYGGISTLTAKLNGAPVSFTASGLGTLNASGAGNLPITGAGSYTLTVTATDPNGSATDSVTFSVDSPFAPPTISISAPLNGTVFTRAVGDPATVVPFSFTAIAGAGAAMTGLSAALDGTALTFTSSGLGSATATGTGSLSLTTPGTYTLSATGLSGALSATDTVTFTIVETGPPTADCGVFWLPPISLGKVHKGGSDMPIKFRIECCDFEMGTGNQSHKRSKDSPVTHNGIGNGHGNASANGHDDHNDCQAVRDTAVVIATWEVFANGSTSQPILYTFNAGSPNPSEYTINGNFMYHLNFPTAKGKHRYHVEVYRFPAGAGSPQVVGTKEFTTK